MSTTQLLKKKLRGIRSTQKITKAMKTISSIKLSQLTALYDDYNDYGKCCENMYLEYRDELLDTLPPAAPLAPVCFVVIASNKGLCGGFNSELLSYAMEEIKKQGSCVILACGKKAITYFENHHIPCEATFVFDDVPGYDDGNTILNEIIRLRQAQKISTVKVIFQKYTNMMRQSPVTVELFSREHMKKEPENQGEYLLIPDKKTVIDSIAPNEFQSILYKYLLEVALGAQASTLMTMRSAYDTATEYCMQLEGEINRKRQSEVTADVIETAAEHS